VKEEHEGRKVHHVPDQLEIGQSHGWKSMPPSWTPALPQTLQSNYEQFSASGCRLCMSRIIFLY